MLVNHTHLSKIQWRDQRYNEEDDQDRRKLNVKSFCDSRSRVKYVLNYNKQYFLCQKNKTKNLVFLQDPCRSFKSYKKSQLENSVSATAF